MITASGARLALVAALVFGVPMTVLAQAPGDPRVAQAESLFNRAESEMDQRLYVAAARTYEECWNLMHQAGHPRAFLVRYNWARALEEAGDYGRAADIYQSYLDEGGRSQENAAVVEARIADLRQRPSSGGGFSPSPIGIAIAGVGAAALIAGAILGGVALAQDGDARVDCTDTSCTPAAYDALVEAHTFANAADGLLFGGLAVLVTGVVLTFVLGDSGESATVAAMCTGDGCAAAISGRW